MQYFGGKYISYTEERPITMNPFRINREEMNVEKNGILEKPRLAYLERYAGERSQRRKTV